MTAYKAPDFNERLAAALAAKQSALDKLRNKPAPDPMATAQRQAARAARDAAAAERQLAAQAAKAAAAIPAPEESDLEAMPPARTPLNEEELKAARDARYAARKARKR